MTDRLVAALRDLPIEWPEVPEVKVAARSRRVGGTVLRPAVPRLIGALALVLVVVVGFVAPVREAVADWLGIGVVRVELVDTLPTGLGSALDLGEPVAVGSVALSYPDGLAAPAGAFAADREISLVWGPSDVLPEVAGTGVGAILTRFDGSLDPAVEKTIGAGTRLTVVTIEGDRAFWIGGEPHSFAFVDSSGRVITSTARLAGNALIWQRDGATYRFESGLGLDEALALFG